VVAHPTRLGCASASRTKWRRLTDLFGKKLRSFGSLGLTVPALLRISRLALAKSFRTLEWVAIPHSKRRGSAAVVLTANRSAILQFAVGTFSIDQEQWNAFSSECGQSQAWKHLESSARLRLEPVCAKGALLPALFFGSVLAYKLLSWTIDLYRIRSRLTFRLDAFAFSNITQNHHHPLPSPSSLAFAAPPSCLPPGSRHQRLHKSPRPDELPTRYNR
jgi:hypothetical protein